MIQNYKDRYGNIHKFDTENEICGIPNCNNKVAAITKNNNKFSKMYCEYHRNGVEIHCKTCNKLMIMSCSDFMKIYPNIPRCKQCQLNELNKTEQMREQARNLGKRLFLENKGMFSQESKKLANIESHKPEVCKLREENKRKNGFYNKGGGYEKGLKLRKENGSLEKWIKSGHTSQAHAKQNITRWNNMNYKDKEKEIKRLLSIGFTPNFKTENNILYYYNKSNKQYVPWEDYKDKFNRKRLTKDLESFINSLKSLDIFQPKQIGPKETYNIDDIIKIYPTFRTQESDTWEGARGAFEQYLIDNKVDWFTYIKLYIKNNNIRPLVVGKSGSLNVNNSGSDISFSTDINDGPSRKFLYDINASWDKTRILIIKAKSERQALYYEYKISNIYNLFES